MAELVEPKPVIESRTLTVNGAATLFALLTTIADADFISEHPVAALWMSALLPVANIVLRFLSGQPIQVGEDQFTGKPVRVKQFWQSTAFWMNVAFLVAAIVGALVASDLVKQYPDALGVFLAVQGIANAAIRVLKTRQPVGLRIGRNGNNVGN